ncbi:MAG: hypothetical protein DRG78_16270 [Epsilonproteobacteria bacterium]|nr:MAG: hypothetical protein DRG78_16270 [Campylobacterota bacterium]
MITIAQISKQFNLSRKTIYNWETSRPELFEYLRNADIYRDGYKEASILIELYSKTIKENFTKPEIDFLIQNNIPIKCLDDYEQFHILFVEKYIKNNDSLFILRIYDKLKNINIIKRYILNHRLIKVKEQIENKKINENTEQIIRHYLSEFIDLSS